MKRSPMPRRYRDTGPDRETVMTVLTRDRFRCVRCGAPAQGERGVAWSLQHRYPRSAGIDNRPCNLLTVCGGCHHRMDQREKAEALANGWRVSRYAKPENVPVLVDHGSRWVYLGNDGTYHESPPGEDRRGEAWPGVAGQGF